MNFNPPGKPRSLAELIDLLERLELGLQLVGGRVPILAERLRDELAAALEQEQTDGGVLICLACMRPRGECRHRGSHG